MPGSVVSLCICVLTPCTHFSVKQISQNIHEGEKCVQRTRNFFDREKGYEAFGVASLTEALKDFLSLTEALLYRLHLKSINKLVRYSRRANFEGVVSRKRKKTLVRRTHFFWDAHRIWSSTSNGGVSQC